ncbi:uncharacterized protein LOC114852693 isoform X2 [Betta splendens]|nr:uncharacterized protein LOC114852693 isoform X2 [Betta splendens]
MRNLLVAVIVGLLGAVHSTPVSTATLTSAENDVLHEAMVDELLIPSVTTQAQSKASSQASQQPNAHPDSRDVNGSSEKSGSGVLEEKLESITEAAFTESGSGTFEDKAESSIQAKAATFTESGSGMFEDKAESSIQAKAATFTESGSGMFEDKAESTTAATDTVASDELPGTQSSDGKSGRRVKLDHEPSTISSTTFKEKLVLPKSKTGLYQEIPPSDKEPARDAGHERTPGWIVVLTCIVALAMLVIVCVAVVTRERWNGPHQALQPQITTGEEREKEMESFLHHDSPREKGGLDEYTLVPLEALPQSYSTH